MIMLLTKARQATAQVSLPQEMLPMWSPAAVQPRQCGSLHQLADMQAREISQAAFPLALHLRRRDCMQALAHQKLCCLCLRMCRITLSA